MNSKHRKTLAVVFINREASRYDIQVVDRQGERRTLTQDQGHNLAPCWSPDGSRILFYSDRDGSFEPYEMNADGSAPRPLFDEKQRADAGFTTATPINPWDNDWGATDQYRASYSPDGEWVVFSRDVDGDRELFLSRRDGTSIQRLTGRKGFDGHPSWRPRVAPPDDGE